jgi:hypothetical protein
VTTEEYKSRGNGVSMQREAKQGQESTVDDLPVYFLNAFTAMSRDRSPCTMHHFSACGRTPSSLSACLAATCVQRAIPFHSLAARCSNSRKTSGRHPTAEKQRGENSRGGGGGGGGLVIWVRIHSDTRVSRGVSLCLCVPHWASPSAGPASHI